MVVTTETKLEKQNRKKSLLLKISYTQTVTVIVSSVYT